MNSRNLAQWVLVAAIFAAIQHTQLHGAEEKAPSVFSDDFRVVKARVYGDTKLSQTLAVIESREMLAQLEEALRKQAVAVPVRAVSNTAIGYVLLEGMGGKLFVVRISLQSGVLQVFDGTRTGDHPAIDWQRWPSPIKADPFVKLVISEMRKQAGEYLKTFEEFLREASGKSIQQYLDEPVSQ
jgi:hypothetical protein